MSLCFYAPGADSNETLAVDRVQAAVASTLPLPLGAVAFVTRHTALRYVRGYPGDVDGAVKSLLQTAEWRVLNVPRGVARSCVACGLNAESHCIVPLGPTRLGSPLLYMSAPRARNLVTEDCVEHLVEALEKSFSDEAEVGEEVYKAGAWIFDGRGYTVLAGAMNPSVGIAYARTLQSHFPERLGRCLLVDVNWAFSVFWRLVRPFLATATADKILSINGRAALAASLEELQATEAQCAWVLEAYDLEALPGNLPSWPLPEGSPKMGTLTPCPAKGLKKENN